MRLSKTPSLPLLLSRIPFLPLVPAAASPSCPCGCRHVSSCIRVKSTLTARLRQTNDHKLTPTALADVLVYFCEQNKHQKPAGAAAAACESSTSQRRRPVRSRQLSERARQSGSLQRRNLETSSSLRPQQPGGNAAIHSVSLLCWHRNVSLGLTQTGSRFRGQPGSPGVRWRA